jgi:hypothetical protein
MKIARQIKIQKLQNKNRMTGQTFNPSGITSEQLIQREFEYINKVKQMTDQEQTELFNSFCNIDKWKDENNIYCSNSFEHNCFM